MSNLTLAQLLSVKDMSSRKAAQHLGVSKSTVNRARAAHRDELPESHGITEPAGLVTFETEAHTVTEADTLLRDKGIDPSEYDVTYGFSEWDGPGGDRKSSVRIKAAPKQKSSTLPVARQDVASLITAIHEKHTIPSYIPQNSDTLVVTPADWQIGKVDYRGGSDTTVETVRKSLASVVERIERHGGYKTIVLAELGDIVENFYNTSSQRETNDLDLTSQIKVASHLMLEVITTLAPHCDELIYVTVPSNHGAVRIGQQQQAATVDNDWGLMIQDQVAMALTMSDKYNHVKVVKPDPMEESVMVSFTTGERIGFVHGHQANSPDKLGEWWKGQSHGRRPVGEADILVTGHWHSLRVQHSGDGRWLIVAPTSDPGSSWYTSRTGGFSQTGMLAFEVEGGNWKNMEIH